MNNPELTPFKLLRQETIGNRALSKAHLRQAGALLKAKGPEVAKKFMLDNALADGESAPNFGAPSKCNIIAQSRPFEEWAISKVSRAIQEYFYAQPVDSVPEDGKALTSSAAHSNWFQNTGVSNFGYTNVQGLGLIFKSAINTYHGVITKVKKRNDKRREKTDRKNKLRALEDKPNLAYEDDLLATNETGHLINSPGIKTTIQCYQTVSMKPYDPIKHTTITLPSCYENKLPSGYKIGDRLSIPLGAPGYVPKWQRSLLSTAKHKRLRLSRRLHNNGARLAVISIGSDWVVFDLRGLLRNVRWRDLSREDLTDEMLLKFFTGDPTIDPARGLITFIYKAENLGIVSRKTVGAKRGKERLLEMTANAKEIGLGTIDLGQTNPATIGVRRVSQNNGQLVGTHLGNILLSPQILQEVKDWRSRVDILKDNVLELAIKKLSDEQQKEYQGYISHNVEATKQAVCQKLGLDVCSLPWSKMNGGTYYISDAYLALGKDKSLVFFTTKDKKGREKQVKRRDYKWYRDERPKLSTEARKALNDYKWEIERSHEGWQKSAKSKQELSRRATNFIESEVKRISQCDTAALGIEDLNIDFFDGSDKREYGWGGFFKPKQENKWWMESLHIALSEKATHRGMLVIEVNPARTSITCPSPTCMYCDKDNRIGEKFVCKKCGKTFHADLEVATTNIAYCVLTGAPMPKLPREQSGDTKSAGGARKRKSAKTQKNVSKDDGMNVAQTVVAVSLSQTVV